MFKFIGKFIRFTIECVIVIFVISAISGAINRIEIPYESEDTAQHIDKIAKTKKHSHLYKLLVHYVAVYDGVSEEEAVEILPEEWADFKQGVKEYFVQADEEQGVSKLISVLKERARDTFKFDITVHKDGTLTDKEGNVVTREDIFPRLKEIEEEKRAEQERLEEYAEQRRIESQKFIDDAREAGEDLYTIVDGELVKMEW